MRQRDTAYAKAMRAAKAMSDEYGKLLRAYWRLKGKVEAQAPQRPAVPPPL